MAIGKFIDQTEEALALRAMVRKDPIILEHGTYTIKARVVRVGCQERNLEDIVSVPPMVAKGKNEEVVVGFDTWTNAPNSKRVPAFDDETGDILVSTIYHCGEIPL